MASVVKESITSPTGIDASAGPIITEIAQPWSPARKSGIATHCIVLGLLAALLAGVGGAAARFLRSTQ